ncbi:hypothetical protein A5906_12765 [Bradyrhizobium sacchari]|uniref:hypothetical protein n=1 Tax=Bradyrhizobium sacchari TaxID=1399419 RepID=UPI0009B023F1|nr:hypothetical protein [Bradyrhizobium sacchari]OPY94643.1 hypothetical protein A5906_12765 [Bradyrhizobium sacchari]
MPPESEHLMQSSSTTTKRERRIRGALDEIRLNMQRDDGCQVIGVDSSMMMATLAVTSTSCKLSKATLQGIQGRVVSKLSERGRLILVAAAG